jgi:hypothetical protein
MRDNLDTNLNVTEKNDLHQAKHFLPKISSHEGTPISTKSVA